MTDRTLGEDLRARAASDPDRIAVIAPQGELTYGQLDRRADRLAAGLAGLGVQRSDRVALLFANGLEAAIAIYAVWRAGAAISPLHPTVKAEKLGFVLADAGARALICDGERAATARAGAERAGGSVRVVEGVESAAIDGAPEVRPVSVDLAGVLYTSGSTGEPKGVALTHANMTFVADSVIEYLEMDGADRVLCVMPLSFGYGLYQLLTCVRTGATLVLEQGFAYAGRVVSVLCEQRITVLPGVPTVFQVLLSLKGLAERELPHLRALTNAGAGLPEPTTRALREAFPNARLYLMYGQTECQRVSYLAPEQVDERPTSVGAAIPGTEAWVEDAEGNVAAPGAVGELMIRGAHVMQGYWGRPRETAAKLRPGRWPWERVMASGDLFRRDEDGYLYFVGRRDDIIKSRGEKVVPREIEDILHAAEGVREAAVVGVPDRLLGEAVVAHVAPRADHELDAGALRRLCAERLEDYMVPRRVVIHDELPRTGNGKLDRAAMRGT